MVKKTAARWLAVGAAFALLATGCSPSSESASTAADSASCADTETFCIGLVLEAGVIDDGAFNEAAWEGVQEAAAATGLSDLIIAIHAGESPARNVDGEIGLAPYHDVEGQVPDSVKEQITAVVTGLVDGSIDPGVTL